MVLDWIYTRYVCQVQVLQMQFVLNIKEKKQSWTF